MAKIMIILENQWVECSEFQRQSDDLKRKKEFFEGNRGELANDLLTVKSVFFLKYKYREWMNGRTYLD